MIPTHTIGFVGHGLARPEGVLAHRSGHLFAADWAGNGGVAIIAPGGAVTRCLAARPVRPNGIALEHGGSFLLAHLSDTEGGVFRLHADGRLEPVVTEVAGRPLPPTNFVVADGAGRLWITVSTRHSPRHRAARPDVADGFIVCVPPGGPPRVVADGLGYTNECAIVGDTLYVNETFGRRISAFALRGDGLGPRQTHATFGEGTFPDGLVADERGGLWVTSVVSNRLIHVRDGTATTMMEDADEDALATTERVFQAGSLTTEQFGQLLGQTLKNISSLAFSGPDRSVGVFGCLHGEALATVPLPAVGAEPIHWRADLGGLIAAGLVAAEEAGEP
ncbi:MAG: SMP-30/gluconolactonase/LRE family protein [Pseudomonadota bacterium]